MATVTTNITSIPQPQSWAGPSSTRAGVSGTSPVGKIIFADTFAVAAKGATDESRVLIRAIFPPGFYYRPSQLWLTARGTAKAVFDAAAGFQLAIGGLFLEDTTVVYDFALLNILAAGSLSAASVLAVAAKTEDDAETNDFQAWFASRQPIAQMMINASRGESNCELTWMDSSSDTTTAISISWRLEMLRFTIEQGVSYEVNAPALTYQNHF